jgi:hypothetical protein
LLPAVSTAVCDVLLFVIWKKVQQVLSDDSTNKHLKLYQEWNDYRTEDIPELNKFGVYTLTNPLIAYKPNH